MEHTNANARITPADFPELRLICWHQSPDLPLSEAEAFGLYERNWRYINLDRLTPAEIHLIEHLKATHGIGVING